jgi:hypothetical protein
MLSLVLMSGMIHGQYAPFPWQKFSLGVPALKMDLPGKPVAQSATLPPHILKFVKRYEGFYIKDQVKGFVISLSFAQYADDVVADIPSAAQGTYEQWKATGATFNILSARAMEVTGRLGLINRGKYVLDGKQNEFANILISEGSMLWQIIVIYKSDDVALQAMLERIVDTVTYK